jgi:hypothetical protein
MAIYTFHGGFVQYWIYGIADKTRADNERMLKGSHAKLAPKTAIDLHRPNVNVQFAP